MLKQTMQLDECTGWSKVQVRVGQGADDADACLQGTEKLEPGGDTVRLAIARYRGGLGRTRDGESGGAPDMVDIGTADQSGLHGAYGIASFQR